MPTLKKDTRVVPKSTSNTWLVLFHITYITVHCSLIILPFLANRLGRTLYKDPEFTWRCGEPWSIPWNDLWLCFLSNFVVFFGVSTVDWNGFHFLLLLFSERKHVARGQVWWVRGVFGALVFVAESKPGRLKSLYSPTLCSGTKANCYTLYLSWNYNSYIKITIFAYMSPRLLHVSVCFCRYLTVRFFVFLHILSSCWKPLGAFKHTSYWQVALSLHFT